MIFTVVILSKLLENGFWHFLKQSARFNNIFLCTVEFFFKSSYVRHYGFFLVFIAVSPTIVHISQNQSVIETNSITLFCNASGNPIPNITWTKIDDAGFKYDGGELTINDTNTNNTGVYSCTASNGIRGNASSFTSVNVQC